MRASVCCVLTLLCLLVGFSSMRPCYAEGFLKRLVSRRKPDLHAVRAEQFLFITDHEFGREAEVAAELQKLGRQLTTDLKLPEPGGTVRIYVFKTNAEFSRYVRKHIPYLTRHDTQRQALFLLRNGKPYIFAVNDADLLRNLRHEFVHVTLNSSTPGVPLWLDEGLAKYYEAADPSIRRPELMAILEKQRRRGWRPNLKRLERLTQMSEMHPLEYAEAWSWVHLLMSSDKNPAGIILNDLADAKNGEAKSTVSQRLEQKFGNPQRVWKSHFETHLLPVQKRTSPKEPARSVVPTRRMQK